MRADAKILTGSFRSQGYQNVNGSESTPNANPHKTISCQNRAASFKGLYRECAGGQPFSFT
jgi:hypothetical protein